MISLTGVMKALLVSLVLAVSAYAVAKINLFGFEAASDRLADQVYQRITAADYGKGRRGQRAVRVIYLDETSIEAMKGYGWRRFPPTYDQQWTMLDDLMTVGGAPPSAMYVDFVYMGQGGTSDGFPTFLNGLAAATRARAWADKPGCLADPLVKIACVLAAGGTPIILAKPSPSDLDLFTDIQRGLDAVAILAPAMVRLEAYPLITDYGFDKAKAARLGVRGFDISPAMGLYAAWCLRRGDHCGEAVFERLASRAREALAGRPGRAPDLSQVFDAPLDVVWGSRPDPDYLAVTRAVTPTAPRPRCSTPSRPTRWPARPPRTSSRRS
ncbi:MAG: hypothetical protein H0X27_01570 [Caulobacteraceae bacterium]|nr:hypothetical protein [Caulobacteraceae bacterium]